MIRRINLFSLFSTWLGETTPNSVDICEHVLEQGLPEERLLRFWLRKKQKTKAMRALVFVIFSVVCFATMTLGRAMTADIYALELAIGFDIEENAQFALLGSPSSVGFKNYKDVNSKSDLYSWMKLGFSSIYFTPEPPTSADESKLPDPTMYLDRNVKVGPVKFVQEIAKLGKCKYELFDAAYPCYLPGAMGSLNIQPTRFDLIYLNMSESDHVLVEYVDSDWYQEEFKETVAGWESSHWLSPDTDHVIVTFLVYNLDADLLTCVSIHFMFSGKGHVWKQVDFRTVPLQSQQNWTSLVAEVLFYCSTTLLLFQEVYGAVSAKRSSSLRRRPSQQSYWTLLAFANWLTILGGYVVLAVWIFVSGRTRKVSEDITRAFDLCKVEGQDCWLAVENLIRDADSAGSAVQGNTLLEGLYCSSFLLQLFATFREQPRLASITKTLWLSLGELAHFLIAFSSVLFVFAMVAVSLFGKVTKDFSGVFLACSSLLRALLGDLDYEPLEDPFGRGVAFIFFSLFTFIATLIMMNMLIAIVMDVYVVQKAEDDASILEDMWNFFWHMFLYLRGERLPVARVFDLFLSNSDSETPFESTRLVSVKDLVALIPGLSDSQAQEELIAAALDSKTSAHLGATKQDSEGAPLTSQSLLLTLATACELLKASPELTRAEKELLNQLLDFRTNGENTDRRAMGELDFGDGSSRMTSELHVNSRMPSCDDDSGGIVACDM
eukprot:TRINITY_DN79046_c0_g1_i1.p1 TRINITY_DN79046_c0_g1~~TRINITY_DN79046_c0_g1_i1.p1  ORF type:complete len:721 (+),score=120.10 TRINITY_DN79046_c0_g1_i1:88-2250(+)